jgi:nitrous oxidase accessory protein NosD
VQGRPEATNRGKTDEEVRDVRATWGSHPFRVSVARRLLWLPAAVAITLLVPASASAVEIANDDTGADAGPPGTTPATCATATHTGDNAIQLAVNAASPGEEILVCAGTYDNDADNQAVNVNKPVALRGAQSGVDARTRSVPDASESIVEDDQGGIYIAPNVDDVTIDGFVVQGTTTNNFEGMFTPPDGKDQRIENTIVRENTFGLYLNNEAGGETVVTHNLFQNNNQPGAASGNGVYGDQGTDGVLVEANRFVDHANTGLQLTATPPITNDGVDIVDNDFENTNSDPALNLNRILLLFTQDSVISGNSVTAPDASGIQLLGEDRNVDIYGNTVTDSTFPGVRIRDCDASTCGAPGVGPNENVTVSENTLVGNDIGVSVADHGYSGELEVHYNRIVGNGSDGVLFEDAGESADAENNWWGCNEGPGAAGCDTVSGAGAADVDADPWLVLGASASPSSIPLGGTSQILADVTHNSDGVAVGSELPDTPIAFATTLGSIQSPVTTSGGQAISTLTAGAQSGTATVSSTLDNETATTTVTIQPQAFAGPAADSVPPETAITNTRIKKKKGKATFEFATQPVEEGALFQCKLDGGAFESCPNAKKYKNLKRGDHTFQVRAIDTAGNIDPTPAQLTFEMKRRKKS